MNFSRINDDELFLKIAELISQKSTCCRKKVGSIIVNSGKIISTGYNGVISKKEHCENIFFKLFKKQNNLKSFDDYIKTKQFSEKHAIFSARNEIHAEQNAILFAEKKYLANSTIYTTLSPCFDCSKLIVISKIAKVVFREKYDRNGDESLGFLKENKIKIVHLK